MQALILVGGEGTRLRPLTLTQPKPAMTLVDRPFIRYMVDWLARHGVDDVIMSCGFKAHGLREALGGELPDGPRVRFVDEPEPLGTAGAIKFAQDLLDERFLALNGDLLTDLDLTALQAQHAETGAIGTLALYPVEDPSAYGLVRRGDGGEITEFLEKPDPDQIDTDEVNAGAYVLERAVLDEIPAGRAVSIEREVFPRLVGNGLYARRLDGYWMDIGTPERYLQASWDILTRRVETEIGARMNGSDHLVAEDAEVDPGAIIGSAVLVDSGARVGDGATIGDRAVVGRRSRVGDGATIVGTALLGGAEIGEGAIVRGSILAEDVRVGERATIAAGSVIGAGARIGHGVTVAADARIEPDAEVT